MSKSRKKRKSCYNLPESGPCVSGCGGSRNGFYSKGRDFFPTSIKSLLILIAEDDDEDNRVDIILDACANHCFIEDARVIAVMDNTVVIRDCDAFRYVCIDCICEVIVDCDTILEELFEEHSLNPE
jgi:hypothetical protein